MKSFRRFGAVALLSTVFLAGCGEVDEAMQNIKEEAVQTADEFVQAAKDEGNVAVRAADHLASDTTNKVKDNIRKKGKQLNLTAQREVGAETVLCIDHKVGDIKLVPGKGQTLSVKTTIWAKDDKAYSRIEKEAETSFVSANGKLMIVTSPKGEPDTNLWDWSNSKYGTSNFMIDYEVEVPAAMTGFEITNNVGGIQIDNLKGVYLVNNDVGETVISRAYIQGESRIGSGAGRLQLGISGIAEDGSLKAKTDVGSIDASFEGSLKFTLDSDSDLGLISGAAKGKQDVNGGGPLVTLSSSVGSITVR
ncbi:hypothetical protein ACM1RC_29205 [Paenibacillus azoreducens]|uniref:hypothetical protein n=1 Tax=Paenibacillus azoreducens TaxID=116718 RepID=UPI0039F521F3